MLAMKYLLQHPASARFAGLLLAAALPLAPSPTAWAGSADEVTIVLVGDVGLNRNGQPVRADGVRRGGFQTWEETTASIADDINGDLNFMNVETVVTDRNNLERDTKGQRGPFNFRTHPNGIRHLANVGFNMLSLANNHSMDYGPAGLKETLRHIGALEKERRVVATGIGMNREEASRPRRVNVNGTEIAFAAIGIVTNNLARHRAGTDKPGQIAYRFDDDFAQIRKRLTKASAGYRILSIHYGLEGRVRTDAQQIAEWRGQAARQDGIDLIVGHHAHVVRGVEFTGGSLIFYGLGNFLHHGTADMTAKGICRDYGLMARVHLKKDANGKLKLRAVEAIPVTDTHFRPRRLTGDKGAARVFALNYLAGTLDDGPAGARGLRFTPQRDGSGLYCVPGADGDGGSIGKLCKRYTAAPPIPSSLRGKIAASCRR
jgi:poly-gamma-glutamate capsule biosynthesis protein CapA/YwtB (metallophosphatase superfamily)